MTEAEGEINKVINRFHEVVNNYASFMKATQALARDVRVLEQRVQGIEAIIRQIRGTT